jgi:hypothetical protein
MALVALLSLGGGLCVGATPPPSAAQWSQLANLPDWSGIWEVDWANKRGIRTPRPQMKLTAEYQKKLDAFRAAQKQGENVQGEAANCVPPGLPGIMSQPYPVEFLYSPGKVVMLIEAYMQFRHIYTDGRKHPEDPDATYMGHSIGHWEGDTLVVDTIGFNDTSWLEIGGYIHSENMHVIERLRRNGDLLTWQATVEDPDMLIKPWTMNAREMRINPDPKATLPESLPCVERDLSHLVTKEHH